ncbi:MAG: HIT domain-containing protein [Chloroflexota bacterium]
MKHLWSPWRMAYVEQPNQEAGCLFCSRLAQIDGPENLILHRGRHAFVILNRFPYTTGHMMIVPFAHQGSLEALDEATRGELMALATRAIAVLRQAYGAQAFNVGANIGVAAGAGVADHVHFHVLPRWPGDTNFMTTTADTRVIPSSLEATYTRLRPLWQPDPDAETRTPS